MNLNKQGRDQLRKNLEELLKEVPEGEKVHFSKEVLDSLLFDVYEETFKLYYRIGVGHIPEMEQNNVIQTAKIKYLVWSGPFLRKIDLNEVSFDNVMWDVDYDPNLYFKYDKLVDPASFNRYRSSGVKKIDLSGTNARVDFTKSLGMHEYDKDESQTIYRLVMSSCDFSGMDLSNSNIGYSCIKNCNLSNAKLRKDEYDNPLQRMKIYDSDLSGVDLSEIPVTYFYFMDEEYVSSGNYVPKAHTSFAINTNFANTGLKVRTHLSSSNVPYDLDMRAYQKYRELMIKMEELNKKLELEKSSLDYDEKNEISSEIRELDRRLHELRRQIGSKVNYTIGSGTVGELIKCGYLEGCYVNGKKILSAEEKLERVAQQKSKYEHHKTDAISVVLNDVKEQIEGFKRK